ncbi:DUF1963 domain-containing protein [Streptomyces sp. NPDC057253]|uniref:DUF1963 domain-containing protein n=1 Tax=Streptomyces sp. NPDC057253 TaxID=3346069 RepID=UPI003644477E
MTLAQQEAARPAARTGGLPCLPDGVDWPDGRQPLVLTVDCAALPREALDIELPSDGSLLFFAQIEYEPERSVVLHVPADVRTTERPAAYELDGELEQVRVYQPDVLYPVPGLTVSPDWRDAPATSTFLDSGVERDDILDDFENAVQRRRAGPHTESPSNWAVFPALGSRHRIRTASSSLRRYTVSRSTSTSTPRP